MSSPKRRIELSQRAKEDFRDILSYTLATWDESQLAKYRTGLDDALHVILRNPSAGRASVKPTLKVLTVEHHRIFYRTTGDTVYVVRIDTRACTRPGLHERELWQSSTASRVH